MKKEPEFQIRNACTEDIEAICALIETAEEMFLVYPAGTFPLNEFQVKELFKQREAHTVVESEGKVVAYANLYNVKPGISAFIGNVVVAPSYRNKGLGRFIVRHMMERVYRDYGNEVHLSVFGFNSPAVLLYRRLGFLPYDIEPRQGLDGKTVALLHMKAGKPL